ncbi:hypothetical protein [Palleronia sp.]|uniref:hypothetical protein n=1 Tax=Palleronia sp. TaxID=1940284 RepID=UPI0035C83189
MTALTEFERLEAPALWRPGAGEQRRDVVVSLGEATLAIYAMDETPLAHWSLPAVERRNPGEMPAIFAPGPEAAETLEIDDDLMIDSIARVDRAIRRRRPRPGILRSALFAGALLAVGALAILWLPGALIRHAVSVAPPAVRADTGARLLEEVTRLTGPVCNDPAGRGALDTLSRRLIGEGRGRLVILRIDRESAVALPGGIVAVAQPLIENYDEPGVVAGHVLAATERARQHDPIKRLLRASGADAALRLMTTGEVSQHDLRAYAEHLLTDQPDPATIEGLLARFEAAGVSPRAYAATLERDSAAQALTEGSEADARPVLSDAAWVALQTICAQ